jgi:hypothetical protein
MINMEQSLKCFSLRSYVEEYKQLHVAAEILQEIQWVKIKWTHYAMKAYGGIAV